MNKGMVEAVYKLSPMQEGILFHVLSSPGVGSYIEQSSWPWRGFLDQNLMVEVWRGLIERHAVLRTSFLWEALEQPVQVVHRKADFDAVEVDCSALMPEDQERLFAEVSIQDRLNGFNLKKPPLMRLTSFRLSQKRYQVVWTYHHLLMDGWSSALLMTEMGTHYLAATQGRPFHPQRVRPFRDYLRWLEAQDLTRAEAFWREKLADQSAPTRLGIMRNAPTDRPESYIFQQRLVEAAVIGRLKDRARENQLTLFTLVQAAWSILLHRYSGDRSILFGTTTSGRGLPVPGIETMIGVFINTIPSPVKLNPAESLLAWLRVQQSEIAKLSSFEYSPLAQVRNWSKIPRNQSFFDTILIYENYAKDVAIPKHTERHLGFVQVNTVTNFPLSLLVYPGDEMLLRMNYDTRRFNSSSIERFLGHLAGLIDQMSRGLNGTIEQLELLSEAERCQLLQDFNSSTGPDPSYTDLYGLLMGQAEDLDDRTALIVSGPEGEIRLSYTSLKQSADRCAAWLRMRGIGPDDLVAVCCQRGPALLTSLLGVLASGAAYLPLDPHFPGERLNYMLKDSGTQLLLTDMASTSDLDLPGIDVVNLDPLGNPPMLETSGFETVRTEPTNLAYTIYTSGSTGKPKGVQISRAALVNFLLSFRQILAPSRSDTLLAVTTISFDIAALELYLPLLAGGRIILARQEQTRDGAALVRLIAQYGVTFMQATPATWQMLLASDWPATPDLNILCGGEALPRPLAEQLLPKGRAVWNLYGPTETTIWSGARAIAQDAGGIAVEPVGPPIAATQIFVLDPQLRPQPIGIIGDLFIGGDGLARGYKGRPGLSAAAFLPHPFSAIPGARIYRTGDLGRFGETGLVDFLGRSDHQIKLRGFRIELGEIDAVLSRHPALRSAATTIRDSAGGDPELVSFLELVPGAEYQVEEVRHFLARSLPAYMLPGRMVVLEQLPLNPSGKVDRKALPQVSAGGRLVGRAFVAARSESERTLTRLWKEVLKLELVGVEDNFFDLGGHSLRLVQLRGKIEKSFSREISMVDLFQHTTIAAFARFLDSHLSELGESEKRAEAGVTSVQRPPAKAEEQADPLTAYASAYNSALAVIGISGRFPGAADVNQFWENLEAGVNAIRFFNREELEAEGIEPAWLDQPSYVRARGYLEGIELFDAGFFGMTPREAEITDPQHRILLEGAWEALEHAGYNPETYPGRIGLFAGAAVNTYAFFNLMKHPEATSGMSWHQLMIGNDQAYMTTRVSYKLNLRGPSVCVQTACSSSLVAVTQACTSLRAGQCDMALAGGIAINSLQRSGYFYETGGIMSADGYCRPFDAQATGTVFGSGMGLVVLKRLADAESDGDGILAIVRGFSINNDGAAKIGYTAPSVEGQVQVIREAQRSADIDPMTIGYIQTHGTGTGLGDPIEFAALASAFATDSVAAPWCALGSVKATIGHLDTAAGVAGMIAAILALVHGKRPPNPMFQQANPEIKFENSPFYINREPEIWQPLPAKDGQKQKRRAAVSSFGIGGTNAHLILEEAPTLTPSEASGHACLLPFSARSLEALERIANQLADHLEQRSDLSIDDVAHTLQLGRKEFPVRSFVVAENAEQAIVALRRKVVARTCETRRRPVVMMFSGQGSQYAGMGAELYHHQGEFRRQLDRCATLLLPLLNLDIRTLMWPTHDTENHDLTRTDLAQPLLFAVDYAIARMWQGLGIGIESLIGHSIGEYVAACLAGVFSLEDALKLVVRRGALMQAQPAGAMLAVAMEPNVLEAYLGSELELAAVNGPERCVVGGPVPAIALLESRLKSSGHSCGRIATSHAFHTSAMEGALDEFRACFASIRLQPPQIPLMSNLTASWMTPNEATNPETWVRHMRQTVRFSQGLGRILEDGEKILLEVGPGKTLAALARGHHRTSTTILASLPKLAAGSDWIYHLRSLGQLWQGGGRLDWSTLAQGQQRRRVALPTYPFERQRYWIGGKKAKQPRNANRASLDQCFFLPTWKPHISASADRFPKGDTWLVFRQHAPFAESLVAELRRSGQTVVDIFIGIVFRRLRSDCFELVPDRWSDYESLFSALAQDECTPSRVLYLWGLNEDEGVSVEVPNLNLNFHAPLLLTRALGSLTASRPCLLGVLINGLFKYDSGDRIFPEKSCVLGPIQVAAREFPNLRTLALDLSLAEISAGGSRLMERLLAELIAEGPRTRLLALRAGRFYQRSSQAIEVSKPTGLDSELTQEGVYLITGGLGGIGLALGRYLASRCSAHLILTHRTLLPPSDQWDDWLQSHPADDSSSIKIRSLKTLEAAGGHVRAMVADVSDDEAMQKLALEIRTRYGRLDGVIHAAGIAGGGLIPLKTREAATRVLAPKVHGTLILGQLVQEFQPRFLVLCSSTSALQGEVGQVDYCAANAFLDAVAECGDMGSTRVISINWGAWREVGMAVNTQVPARLQEAKLQRLAKALSSEEGVEAFERILSIDQPRVVVSPFALGTFEDEQLDSTEESVRPPAANESAVESVPSFPRPSLATEFVAPNSPDEILLARIWSTLIGIDRVGRNDNFFELGGDSLLGLQVVAQINRERSSVLTAAGLYEAPTVAALARLLVGRDEEGAFRSEVSRGSLRKSKIRQRRNIEQGGP